MGTMFSTSGSPRAYRRRSSGRPASARHPVSAVSGVRSPRSHGSAGRMRRKATHSAAANSTATAASVTARMRQKRPGSSRTYRSRSQTPPRTTRNDSGKSAPRTTRGYRAPNLSSRYRRTARSIVPLCPATRPKAVWLSPLSRPRGPAAAERRGRRGGRRGLGEAALAGEELAPDGDGRQLVGAAAQQAQRGALHRAVAADIARGPQRVVEREPGGRRGLGDHLGVVELVAAAERQAARGEHERGRPAALGGERGDPHRAAARDRPAVGPDERKAQRLGALLGRRALG